MYWVVILVVSTFLLCQCAALISNDKGCHENPKARIGTSARIKITQPSYEPDEDESDSDSDSD